jgi:hypothetical protein
LTLFSASSMGRASKTSVSNARPSGRRRAGQRASLPGHANMAHGEPILWIIGVDEDSHQVTGASDVELADWWAQVVAALDQGIAPGLTPLIVPVSADRSVVALYMTTERTPYVVRRQSEQRSVRTGGALAGRKPNAQRAPS